MSSVYVDGRTATLIEHTKGLLEGPSGHRSPALGRLRAVPRWMPDGTDVTTVEQAAVLMGTDTTVAAHTVLQSKVSDELKDSARIFLSNKASAAMVRHPGGRRQPPGNRTVQPQRPAGNGKFQEELHPRGTGAQGGQFVKKGTSSQGGGRSQQGDGGPPKPYQQKKPGQYGPLKQGPKAHPIYEVASHGDRATGDGASLHVGGHTYKLKVEGNKITVTGEKGHELILHGGEGIDPIKLAALKIHQYQTQFRNEDGTLKKGTLGKHHAAKMAAAKDTGDNTLPKKTGTAKVWGDLSAEQQNEYLTALAEGKSPEEAGRPYGFVPAKKTTSTKAFSDSLETKGVVRHVRTQAGVKKYGQPIGSVIVADVNLPNLKGFENEWEYGEAIRHKSGKTYLIVQHPDDPNDWYALDYENPDWAKPAANGTEREVYEKLNGPVAAKKTPAKKATPAKKTTAKKAPAKAETDIEMRQRIQDSMTPAQQRDIFGESVSAQIRYYQLRDSGKTHAQAMKEVRGTGHIQVPPVRSSGKKITDADHAANIAALNIEPPGRTFFQKKRYESLNSYMKDRYDKYLAANPNATHDEVMSHVWNPKGESIDVVDAGMIDDLQATHDFYASEQAAHPYDKPEQAKARLKEAAYIKAKPKDTGSDGESVLGEGDRVMKPDGMSGIVQSVNDDGTVTVRWKKMDGKTYRKKFKPEQLKKAKGTGGEVTVIKGGKPAGWDDLTLKEKHKVAHLINMHNGVPGKLAVEMVKDARNPKVSEPFDNYSDQQILDGIRSMRQQFLDLKRNKKPVSQRLQDMLQDYINEARSRGI